MKKVLKIFICCTLAVLILALPVIAGNVSYNYKTGNTGRTFNPVSWEQNTKIHAGEAWVNTITSISFTDSKAYTTAAYGMAFMPTDPVYGSGVVSWRKSTGTVYGGWTSGSGGVGSYRLVGRIDDVLTGTGSVVGRWNSDSTY